MKRVSYSVNKIFSTKVAENVPFENKQITFFCKCLRLYCFLITLSHHNKVNASNYELHTQRTENIATFSIRIYIYSNVSDDNRATVTNIIKSIFFCSNLYFIEKWHSMLAIRPRYGPDYIC